MTQAPRHIPQADLLAEIEACLARTGMTETAFGREAMADPGFVASLRRGRDCRFGTMIRVRRFIAARGSE